MAGERILFVDDEEQIRKLLSTWLARHGYEVTVANDGWEALKAVRTKAPDLVITNMTSNSFTVKNQGEVAAGPFRVTVVAGPNHADVDLP